MLLWLYETNKRGIMLLTVKIIYLDGSCDIKECWNVDEICLDNVKDITIIRAEKVA
jgi:hypothetical protein